MDKQSPDFSFEQAAMARGFSRIAGVDEVGRGPLAGPVTAAAVVLDPARIPEGLNDSKKLTAKRRAVLYEQIMEVAEVSVAHATVAEIDEINILRASHLAMERAIAGLPTPPEATRGPCRLRPPRLWQKCVETGVWWIWRNSIPGMVGKETPDMARKSTSTRSEILGSPHTIGVRSNPYTISCIKRKL